MLLLKSVMVRAQGNLDHKLQYHGDRGSASSTSFRKMTIIKSWNGILMVEFEVIIKGP